MNRLKLDFLLLSPLLYSQNNNDLNSLIELENNSELRRGFKKHKHLELVLFKVIDYRTHILKKGFFCAEVENFLYPPKAPRKPAGYKEMESSI